MTRKRQKGMILIELLTAMAVFAIGIMTIFALFVSATRGAIISLDRTNATLQSNETLEAALSILNQDPSYLTPGRYEVGVNNNNEWVLLSKSGLIGHFLLSNNAIDSSVYRNHGLMKNISFAEDRKNQPFNAARFNGNNSMITTEFGFSLQTSGPLSISAWVLGTGSGTRIIAGRYDFSRNTSGYVIYRQDNSYFFKIAGPQGTDIVSAPSGNVPWEHIVGVYDPADQRMDIYINGRLGNTKRTTITSINTTPFLELTIGTDTSRSNVWEGLISDVRVYNQSLTANEVSGLNGSYSTREEKSLIISDASQLIASWSFNEGIGCIVHNNISNDHGRINGCNLVSWTENRYGRINRSLGFTNAQIIVPGSNSLHIRGNVSISIWVRLPNPLPNTEMVLLNKRANGPDDYSFLLMYHGSDRGYSWAISSGTGRVIKARAPNTAFPNKWQNIIVTFDGNTRRMFINNNEITNLEPMEGANPGTESNLSIGRDLAGQNSFTGTIDDLRIYNKILTRRERISILTNHLNYYLE